MDRQRVDEILDRYDRQESWLVMILQDLQEQFNYLPEEALEYVAQKLQVPVSRVFQVATFYSSLSLKERGRHVIRVCDGTACHLRGFVNLRDAIRRELDISANETTPDKRFTLEVVACLGACALAPVMAVDGEYHGQMTPEKVKTKLSQYG